MASTRASNGRGRNRHAPQRILLAGRGCQTDHNIERYLRDVIHTFPAAGTSDVQRLPLAEVALGTHRGAWSSRLSTDADALLEAA